MPSSHTQLSSLSRFIYPKTLAAPFSNRIPSNSSNRIVKVELALRIVLALQLPQPLQSPRFVPVQHLRRLITRRIIDVGIQRASRFAGVESGSSLVAVVACYSREAGFAGRPDGAVGTLGYVLE